jgi:small subunit ribosomal protein S20
MRHGFDSRIPLQQLTQTNNPIFYNSNMPNTKSAKKAMRSSAKKYEQNSARKWKIKNALKDFRKVLATDPANYLPSLSKVFSAFDKAVKTNLVHRNKADRKKSRLAKLVDRVLAK